MTMSGTNRVLYESATLSELTAQQDATGYVHPAYCESLSEFGCSRLLPRSGGSILVRQITGSTYVDAMGPYPLFACRNWSQLHADLESIANSLVSVALVTDPFGEFETSYLNRCFPDLVISFKEHFVVDLSCKPEEFVHSHHQRNARKARREMRIENCEYPVEFLEDWMNLYRSLIERHQITGMSAFSQHAFEKQLRVPGLVMLRAVQNGVTVGALLWYEQGNRAYYHLGAYSLRGYELGASFALFDFALRHFAERGLEWLNLGSGAGTDRGTQGLTRFKQGWSTGVRTAYFCGRIFDPAAYRELVEARGLSDTRYFPAYRTGEFF